MTTTTKKVYICSPLSGDVDGNIRKARCICRYAVMEHGVIPIAPHIYLTQFLDDSVNEEREFGLKAGLSLLSLCDELWYFGDTVSKGMTAEICEAMRLGLPIRYFPEYRYENYLHERNYETNEMQ